MTRDSRHVPPLMRRVTHKVYTDRYSIEVTCPPCPFCKQAVKFYRHWAPHTVENAAYKHCCRPFGGDRSYVNQSDEEHLHWKRHYEKESGNPIRTAWTRQCIVAVRQAREAAQPPKLSPEEIRARQSKAGKQQRKSDKRRGGERQDSEDKRRGGEIAAHNRWHVARGIKSPGCKLCV